MPTISIIVPIYKAAQTIIPCIQSILFQTYGDFELLLVDDGSPDDCPQICDEYAKKDARIHVIHQKNQGVSAARNRGVEVATGAYITFIDSDDYVSENYLAALLDATENGNYDFVCASKANVYGEKIVRETGCDFALDLTREIPPDYYSKLSGFTAVWMALFKREIMQEHRIRFNPAVRYGEDTAFVYEYLTQCQKIRRIPETLYFYRVYDGSAAHKYQEGIVDCLLYRQSFYAAFINRLILPPSVRDTLVAGFAYLGYRLLTHNVLLTSKEQALLEIRRGVSVFHPYVAYLAAQLARGETIRFAGIPESFDRQIQFLAKTTDPKKVLAFVASNYKRKQFVQCVKGLIKKVFFCKKN